MEARLERSIAMSISALMASDNEAIKFFTVRDLVNEDAEQVERLWSMSEPRNILKKQFPGGSWKYPGSLAHHQCNEDFYQLETFRQPGVLVEKYGFNDDPHIENGFNWLLKMWQDDGGWAWLIRTRKIGYHEACASGLPVLPDKTKPVSHALTGVVLRAYAAHPDHRTTEEAKLAGKLLVSRFFKPDTYVDRCHIGARQPRQDRF